LAIKELGGYTCEVNGIPSEAYPTPAKTCFFIIDKTKIKTIYGVVVPDYEESLRKFMGLL
jgi:dTDP-4-dehydrorhamnose reductase